MARHESAGRGRSSSAILLLLLVAACAAPGYSPYPLVVETLPPDAFARCRELLLRQYGGLTESDEATFRLQTAWTPISDPPGERRASIFRSAQRADELSVVVELRWLRIPVFGVPSWTAPRGDAAAERELAAQLGDVLTPASLFGAAAAARVPAAVPVANAAPRVAAMPSRR